MGIFKLNSTLKNKPTAGFRLVLKRAVLISNTFPDKYRKGREPQLIQSQNIFTFTAKMKCFVWQMCPLCVRFEQCWYFALDAGRRELGGRPSVWLVVCISHCFHIIFQGTKLCVRSPQLCPLDVELFLPLALHRTLAVARLRTRRLAQV